MSLAAILDGADLVFLGCGQFEAAQDEVVKAKVMSATVIIIFFIVFLLY
jgi:hypothetical protein